MKRPRHFADVQKAKPQPEKTVYGKLIKKTVEKNALKGVIVVEPVEENLIQLLDLGKIDEFRQRLAAEAELRRKQMYERVLAGY